MAEQISWFATGATILAALVTASNLGARITGYGFVIFLFGSIAWAAMGALTGQPALLWTNAVLTLLNIFGIWRWLGRQAKIEEGGEAALEASRETPGEALFPASFLTSGALRDRAGREIGHAADAMIGCRSGRIHYVVASTGGVAGIAEELRRVDWRHIEFDGDALTTGLSDAQFERLAILPKGDWPGS